MYNNSMENMINLDDYKTLEELYTDSNNFIETLSTNTPHYFEGISYTSFLGLLYLIIYNQYYNDKISYLDRDTFERRLQNTIASKSNYFYNKYKIEELLASLEGTNLMQKSKANNTSSTETHSGTQSVQRTASTPTGVTINNDDMINELKLNSTETTSEGTYITNGFTPKYTNFEGQQTGSQLGKGSIVGETTRQGSYSELLDLYEKLPLHFVDELLDIASQHFIFAYDL